MLKIITVGDPHIQTDNIPEVNFFLDKLEELLKKENPDLCIILGDVLHTHERLHTMALNKAYEMVRRIKAITEVYMIVGNHDSINNQVFLDENHWMNGMKEWENVTVVDTVVYRSIHGRNLVFCPYVFPGRFVEALTQKSVNDEITWVSADCIFAHQEFAGCKYGGITSLDGDKWPLDYPSVVSGHIHSNQTPQENIYYPGSAMQHAFGESEKNIIAILTWKEDSEKYGLSEVDLGLPRKRIVHKDIHALDDYDVKEGGDKVKLSVSGDQAEFKAFKNTQKYKELVKKGVKIAFKPKKNVTEKNTEEADFMKILLSLVNEEKDPYLFQVHELVVQGKEVDLDDILYL